MKRWISTKWYVNVVFAILYIIAPRCVYEFLNATGGPFSELWDTVNISHNIGVFIGLAFLYLAVVAKEHEQDK